jgi:hypothetical protein
MAGVARTGGHGAAQRLAGEVVRHDHDAHVERVHRRAEPREAAVGVEQAERVAVEVHHRVLGARHRVRRHDERERGR